MKLLSIVLPLAILVTNIHAEENQVTPQELENIQNNDKLCTSDKQGFAYISAALNALSRQWMTINEETPVTAALLNVDDFPQAMIKPIFIPYLLPPWLQEWDTNNQGRIFLSALLAKYAIVFSVNKNVVKTAVATQTAGQDIAYNTSLEDAEEAFYSSFKSTSTERLQSWGKTWSAIQNSPWRCARNEILKTVLPQVIEKIKNSEVEDPKTRMQLAHIHTEILTLLYLRDHGEKYFTKVFNVAYKILEDENISLNSVKKILQSLEALRDNIYIEALIRDMTAIEQNFIQEDEIS